jgi:ATP/maltotriose-dependent transcriptional regulator MalT
LTRLLDESPARIKLLIAPAGYGKTTLARQWLSQSDTAVSWITADATAIDLVAFAAAVGTACSAIVPGASERLEARLHISSNSDSDALVFAEMLAAELLQWPSGAVLGIDDYHRVGSSRACEDFFDHLVENAPITVLVAARRRPRWATAKRIVYGEILEIDKAALAMTHEEASAALTEQPVSKANALRDLADGWPAILGLANVTTSIDLPHDGIPTALYQYLADEVYQALSPISQRTLCFLSLLPSSTWWAASECLGDETIAQAQMQGENAGVISRDVDGAPDIHPLLRRYLRRRSKDYTDKRSVRLLDELWARLLRAACWDAAFDFAVWTGRTFEIPSLLEAGLGDMLDRGRTMSVAKWLEHADHQDVTVPIVRIAAAEISARRGSHRRAEMLAGLAAADPTASPELAARALAVAGQAAHLVSRDQEAIAYYRRALELTSEHTVRQRAEWGIFISQVDLGLADASSSLSAIEENSGNEPASILAAASARLLLAMRFGPLAGAEDQSAALQVISDVRDPVRRCGFWVTYGGVLGLRAEYARAAAAAEELERDAREHRLDFTRPYSRAIVASCLLGRRDFGAAADAAEESRRHAESFGDAHGAVNALAILGRIELSQQRYRAAEVRFRPALDLELVLSMSCEIHCCYALALACQGRGDYTQSAAFGDRSNCGLEARVLSACAHAVFASVSGSADVALLAGLAVNVAMDSGNLDSLVVAYRAHPEFLLSADLRDPLVASVLMALMVRAQDVALAKKLGLAKSDQAILSRRETEIHSLVALGLTNRQIADRLVISEATVKLHVHHILEKLGVKTRTEAALRQLAGG